MNIFFYLREQFPMHNSKWRTPKKTTFNDDTTYVLKESTLQKKKKRKYTTIKAFHVTQWANNLPVMQETQEIQEMQVQSLGWEDPLEEGMATHSTILAWRIPGTDKRQSTVHSFKESDMTEATDTHAEHTD